MLLSIQTRFFGINTLSRTTVSDKKTSPCNHVNDSIVVLNLLYVTHLRSDELYPIRRQSFLSLSLFSPPIPALQADKTIRDISCPRRMTHVYRPSITQTHRINQEGKGSVIKTHSRKESKLQQKDDGILVLEY